MPLRDHFHPPLDNIRHWEGFHATWPVMIVANLRQKLPRGYFAEPRVHSGSSAEIDVAAFENDGEDVWTAHNQNDNGGGVATAVWAPPQPTMTIASDLPEQDVYEVLIYDEKRHCRLVAAVEIVSPADKDRPEHRNAFVSKCVGLLREHVCVVIVDIVSSRTHNLYKELLELVGHSDPIFTPESSPLYAVACRLRQTEDKWLLETWAHFLSLGQPLPTPPLWLTEKLAVPLEMEESYEQSCRILTIP